MITKELKERLQDLVFSKKWSLFLDRDGVINKKVEGDYVRSWDQFVFIPGVFDAIRILRPFFKRIFIVTNQRGIARGLFSEKDLELIHGRMLSELAREGLYIDAVYFCPHDEGKCDCRKPKTGMAFMAKRDFPEVDFFRSVMVGDSASDIKFGKKLNMLSVLISENENTCSEDADICFKSLLDFGIFLKKFVEGRGL